MLHSRRVQPNRCPETFGSVLNAIIPMGCIDSKQPRVEELSFQRSEQMSDEKSEKLLEIETWQKKERFSGKGFLGVFGATRRHVQCLDGY